MPISIYSTQLGSKETFSPLKSRTGKDGRKRKNIKFLRMYEKKIFRKRRRSKLHQNVVGEWLEDRRSWGVPSRKEIGIMDLRSILRHLYQRSNDELAPLQNSCWLSKEVAFRDTQNVPIGMSKPQIIRDLLGKLVQPKINKKVAAVLCPTKSCVWPCRVEEFDFGDNNCENTIDIPDVLEKDVVEYDYDACKGWVLSETAAPAASSSGLMSRATPDEDVDEELIRNVIDYTFEHFRIYAEARREIIDLLKDDSPRKKKSKHVSFAEDNIKPPDSILTWRDVLKMFTTEGAVPPRVRPPEYSDNLFLPEPLQRSIQSRILSTFGRHNFDMMQRSRPSVITYKAGDDM